MRTTRAAINFMGGMPEFAHNEKNCYLEVLSQQKRSPKSQKVSWTHEDLTVDRLSRVLSRQPTVS
jgi:hypothetical protein